MSGLENPIHLIFLLVLLLVVFGAKRLPEMGRSLGSGLRGFKDALGADASAQAAPGTDVSRQPAIGAGAAEQPALERGAPASSERTQAAARHASHEPVEAGARGG